MRPCTRQIVSAEDDIRATSLDDVLVEHAPWCRTAPTALPIHIKPLEAREDAVERSWDEPEVECLDQQDGVPLLAVPHEAVQLFLERPGAMRGLLLVRPERAQLALLQEHALHAVRPNSTRQLVLEVLRARVEPSTLELAAIGAPQGAQEMPLLADVIEPCQPNVAVLPEATCEISEATHRHDDDALGLEIATTATRKRLDSVAVARALDKHDSA